MWRTLAAQARPGSQLKDGLSLETTCLHVSLAPFLPTPRRVRRTGSAGRRGLGIPVRGRFPCFRNPWPVRQAVRRPSSLCALEKALVCLSQAVCCADIFRTRLGNQLQMVSHDDTPSGGCCPTGDLKRRSLVTVTSSLLAAATPTFTSPDVAPMQTRGHTPIFLIKTLFTEVFFPIKSFETSVTSSLTLPRARYKYSKQISTKILQSLLKC